MAYEREYSRVEDDADKQTQAEKETEISINVTWIAYVNVIPNVSVFFPNYKDEISVCFHFSKTAMMKLKAKSSLHCVASASLS